MTVLEKKSTFEHTQRWTWMFVPNDIAVYTTTVETFQS